MRKYFETTYCVGWKHWNIQYKILNLKSIYVYYEPNICVVQNAALIMVAMYNNSSIRQS